MKMYSVNNFAGGANNYIDPRLLESNQAQQISNGDISTGGLRSIPDWTNTGETDPVIFEHYGAANRSAVSWWGKNYWSYNDAEETPFYGGDCYTLGIDYPDATPAIELSEQFTKVDSVTSGDTSITGTSSASAGTTIKVYVSGDKVGETTVDANSTWELDGLDELTGTEEVTATSSTGFNGEYRYCWTYLNEDDWESAPGESDSWYTATNPKEQRIKYILPSTLPDGIVKIRVYRTVANGNEFYLVNEHTSIGVTVTDNLTDMDLLFNLPLESLRYYPPPDEGKYLTERDGVFFLAVNDRLYFSEGSNPHAWEPLNWIGFEDTITGIAKEFYGILVFTMNRIFRITGSDITNLAKQEIPAQQGCVDYRTIGTISNAPIWLSNDGICLWDGSKVQLLSKGKYKIDLSGTIHAVVADDVYYLFHSSGAICFDHRYNNQFREIDITCDYAWYDGNTDMLYGIFEGEIHEFYQGGKLQAKYRSPWVGGGTLTRKSFRRFFIHADCPVSISIYKDGIHFLSQELTQVGKQSFYLPTDAKGQYIEVQLEFTGSLYEWAVEYEETL